MTQPRFVFMARRYPENQFNLTIGTTAEAQRVFSDLEQDLAEYGLSLADVVKLRFFYTSLADFPDMNQVREPLFRARFAHGQFPSSTGVITGGRGGTQPRFELEVIAHAGKVAFNAPGVIEEWEGVRPPFSHANIAGGLIFISGQGAYNDDGGLLSDDPTEQASASLGVLTKILAQAGCDTADVLSLTAYLTPIALKSRSAIEAQLGQYLTGAAIATVIPVTGLAFPGMEVEIEVCARAKAAPGQTPFATASHDAGAARAIRYGGLLLARGGGEGQASVAACLKCAFDDLDAAMAGVGAVRKNAGTTTIGFAPAADRSAVGDFAADIGNVTLAPLPEGAEPSVIVEILGEI
jgi:enamine deaminase RidA (YjgF/YER057c/UK114 family)